MDCRLLVDPSGGVTAVVDVSVGAIRFIKIFVRGLHPVFSPNDKLFVAVPTCGDRILPSKFCAFRIFVGSLIAVPLRFGRRHIHLLFADIILILLLPALCFRQQKLGGCEAFFFAVAFAKIFLFGFVLPLAFVVKRSDGKHNMSVGIVSVDVVNSNVSAHTICNKVDLDIVCQQTDPLFFVEFNRQSDH